MKKKLLILLALVLCLTPVFGLFACGDDVELQYNVKYIRDDDNVRSKEDYKQTYILFEDNGCGRYHYYDSDAWSSADGDYVAEYTIKFKYTYVDKDKSAVACFFDGITFGDKDTGSRSVNYYSDWAGVFTVSKNVVVTSGGRLFINKNYLSDELKNYGNVEDND